MHSASKEWMARVAARNAIETAKAMREGRAVALSAALADKSASTEGGAK